MKRTDTKWLFACFAAFSVVLCGGNFANGQQPVKDLPINQLTSYKGEEFLLIGSAMRGAGEPVIAINPKDPNNIIVGAMASLNYVEGEPIPSGFKDLNWNAVVTYRNTLESSKALFAITYDRGRTWRMVEDPFRDYFKMNGIADTSVGFGKDGRMFIGAMNFFPQNATPLMRANELEPSPGLLYGNTDIAWSDDAGKTWSLPVHVMGQATPQEEYGPGVKPRFQGKTPYDRPFLVIDQSTGTLYIPGNGSGGEPVHPETFIRASDDNGKTFGLVYAYDSPDYPESGMAARPAAANGVLGVAYTASSVPSSTGAKCPCIVFGLSRDEGKTFERYVAQSNVAIARGFNGLGAPALAADPSHPGRFAVMSLNEGSTEMLIYVTADYGKTWKGPVRAGGTPGATINRPDIAYSPRGELAVMWLAAKPDQSFTAWSALSHDGGEQFSKPIEVSTAPSPARAAIKDRGNNWDGNDLSSIVVDEDFAHIVWADGRSGFLGTWYARVPISSY
jgi:hypothetical protein